MKNYNFEIVGTTDVHDGKIEAAKSFSKFGQYSLENCIISKNDSPIGTLKLRIDGNRLVISEVGITNRGVGHGTDLLLAIASHSESLGLIPALYTEPGFGKLAQKRLRDFYSRIGFVKNSGGNKIKNLKEEFYFPVRQIKQAGEINNKSSCDVARANSAIEMLERLARKKKLLKP